MSRARATWRAADRPAWAAAFMAAGLGILLAATQAPFSFPWIVFLVVPGIVWLLDGCPGVRMAAGLGWCLGAGYFGASLHWIVEPFQVDRDLHGWLAPFALAGLAGGLALFWAVALGLARALWCPGPARVLALAAAFGLAEYGRATLFTGFPWAMLAHGWIETPVAQAAALFGPHMLGFLTVLAAGLPMAWAGRRGLAGGTAAAAALLAVGLGYGALRLAEPAAPREDGFTVRLVQPNAPQHLKWDPAWQQVFFDRHLALTGTPAARPPDVVLWSETAVPFVLDYAPELQAAVAGAAAPAPLILGIQRYDAASGAWFNSLAVLGEGGRVRAVYDKHHLVPFGEYLPFRDAFARLGLAALEPLVGGGFTPGPGPALIHLPDLPAFLPLICYEAIFPHQMRAPGGRAAWLVHVTNDAWFGTFAGPFQHLVQIRMRAIEQGLPVARAANTGVSAMIDPFGRTTVTIPLGEAGMRDAVLPAALPATPYARFGDAPALFTILLSLALTLGIVLSFRFRAKAG